MAQNPIYKKLGVQLSTEILEKNIKIMWWGRSGTWKTETAIRLFPHVLVIDSEGNTDQVDRDEVPPFLVVKTKDTDDVLEVIDAVDRGDLRFPTGEKVETLFIDSGSVLYAVTQEISYKTAEQRNVRYNKPKDEATLTQVDWNLGKRPIKKLYTRFNNTRIPFLLMSCREKDLYEETKPGEKNDNPKKIGYTWDMMKNAEYEFNAVLRFMMTNNQWSFEVSKVQGKLKTIFPMGRGGSKFPIAELLAYAKTIKPKTETALEMSEEQAAEKAARPSGEVLRKETDLIAYASSIGLDPKQIGKVLGGAGFKGFDPQRWDEMTAAMDAAVVTQ